MAKYINSILLLNCLDLTVTGLLLPIYGAHVISLGGTHFLYGVIGSVVAAIGFVFGPIAGSLSDSKGRVPILRFTIFMSSVLVLFSGLISSLYFLVFCRWAWALFSHTSIINKALVADLMPSDKLPAIYGQMGALSALGFIVGPILGGYLYEKENGFCIITTFASLLLLISAGTTYRLSDAKKETKASPQPATLGFSAEFRRIFGNIVSIDWSKYGELFALKLLTDVATYSFFPNLVLILKEVFELSPMHVGYSLGCLSVMLAISNLLIGKLRTAFYTEDTSGLQRISHGIILQFAALLAMYLKSSPGFFAVCLVPFATGMAILGTTYTEAILNMADENEKGKIMGAAESIVPLSGLVTPLISGIIMEYVGLKEVILLSVVPAFLAVVLVTKLRFSLSSSESGKAKAE